MTVVEPAFRRKLEQNAKQLINAELVARWRAALAPKRREEE